MAVFAKWSRLALPLWCNTVEGAQSVVFLLEIIDLNLIQWKLHLELHVLKKSGLNVSKEVKQWGFSWFWKMRSNTNCSVWALPEIWIFKKKTMKYTLKLLSRFGSGYMLDDGIEIILIFLGAAWWYGFVGECHWGNIWEGLS